MRRLKIYAQMLFRYRPREFWNDVLSESFDLRGCPLRLVMRGRTTEAREKTRSQIKHNPPPKRRAPKRGTAKGPSKPRTNPAAR